MPEPRAGSSSKETLAAERRAFRIGLLRGYAAIGGMLVGVLTAAWANNILAAALWLVGAGFWPFFWRSRNG